MHTSPQILDSQIPLQSERRMIAENNKKKDLFERKEEDPSFGFCVEVLDHLWEQENQGFLPTMNWSIGLRWSTVDSDLGKCSCHFAKYPLRLEDAADQNKLKE